MSWGYWGLDDDAGDTPAPEYHSAAIDRDVAEDLMRLAMPAPLPGDTTFHYHPDDTDVPRLNYYRPVNPEHEVHPQWEADPTDWVHRGHPGYRENEMAGFTTPAVEARVNGKHAGYLSWNPESKKISQIQVFRGHQRQSIGTSLFDFAKQHEPDLQHSRDLTPSGEQWSQHERSRTEPNLERNRREVNPSTGNYIQSGLLTAMPNPLPQGVHFRYHPELVWSPGVTAHYKGKQIGSLEWYHDDHIMVDLGSRKPGEIDRISVDPKHQGNSVASSMFDFAKQHEPRLHHSDRLTPDGEGWSAYEKSRHAAVTQNLVDRLHDEFSKWYHHGGGIDQDEFHEDHLDPISSDQPARGPVGDWANVERFLKQNYPAAHKNHGMGLEEAGHIMDGHDPMPYQQNSGADLTPYATGPDAVSAHGYDPKEIAAGMLLLHNKSTPFRGDLAQEDQARLNDIFDKRVKMQRTYEQRNARLAGLHGDLPENITFRHHPAGFEPFPDVIQPNVPVSSSYPTVSAHDGDRMIGHIQWRDDGHPRRDNEIWDLRVHPDYQRRGVATALFDWTTDKINPDLKHSNNLSDEGRAFAEAEDRRPLAEERYEAWRNGQPMPKRFAGRNGDLPPMTMEPFGTRWSDGIMARHAIDGRPLGHLHWYSDGEIETVRVHPDFQRRGIASAMLKHANSDPETYELDPGKVIHHSNNLTPAGRAWARADGHTPDDHEIEHADGDPGTWAWTAVKNYVPAHIPYTGQNEAEMSNNLYPERPDTKVLYKLGSAGQHRWPNKWVGNHPDIPFDKRWGPNHPQHTPAPWDN